MKKLPLILILLGVVALTGWAIRRRLAASGDSQGRQRGTAAVAIEVAPVQKGSIRDIGSFTGSLMPKSQFLVAPKIGGRVKQVMVNVGDLVTRDQLIGRLDDEEYVQQVEEAQAELQVAEANVEACASALEVARFLQNHSLIERVWYAGLPSHPQHAIAKRLFPEGRYGAMLNFDVAGCDSRETVFRFLDALRIILPATSLGDVYSLIVNPPRSTNNWLSDEELAAIGIGEGTFRLSVGIEDVEDLKEDLDRALAASAG